jgi:hypothetical protein
MVMLHVDAQTTALSVNPKFSSSRESEFTIRVSIDHVTNLYGFQLKLGYNTTILDIVQVDIQPFLKKPTYVAANETHEDEGWYSLAIASYPPASAKNGSGTLVTITFKVMSLGNCTLHLYDITLANSKAEEIPYETIDGEVTTLLISSISISASPDAVTVGKNTTISGSITPARAGVTVTIHYRLIDEVAWNTTTVITDSTGGYSYVWAPSKVGTYEVKSSWPGDADTLGSESSIIEITVKAAAPYLLYAIIVIVIVIVVAIVIYFLKIRKP